MTTATDPEPIPDVFFLENVAEARENGYELLCAFCGVGIYDDSDAHDRGCPKYVPWEPDR